MLITEDSPLRKLPHCEPTQKLFLDGIRFTIEMVDLSFNRLCSALWHASDTKQERQKKQIPPQLFGAVLLDAWSMIDSIERLRTLVQKMRGLKRTEPIRDFLKYTEKIRLFRNRLHHLNEDLAKGLYVGKPVLGSVSWVTYVDNDTPTLRIFVLTPGSLMRELGQLVNPMGNPIHPPMDLITLDAHGEQVSLTEQFKQVGSLIIPLENGIRKATGHLPQAGSDFLLSCDVSFPSATAEDPEYKSHMDRLRKANFV